MQNEAWNSCQINIKSAEPQIGWNTRKNKYIDAFVFTHESFALPRYTWQMLAEIWVLNNVVSEGTVFEESAKLL